MESSRLGRLLIVWFVIGSILSLPAQDVGEKNFDLMRRRMVREQLVTRGIKDPRVLRAMGRVPRHLFLPKALRHLAYRDGALPIVLGQTISQPFMVAYMTQALDLKPTDRVLEIGTGSGYQTAILAELVQTVYTIEYFDALSRSAVAVLRGLGYANCHFRIGDGFLGWPEAAPFDAIVVTCAPEEIPDPLVDQLKEGGVMVIPLGRPKETQSLVRAVKREKRLSKRVVMEVMFVPMLRDDVNRLP